MPQPEPLVTSSSKKRSNLTVTDIEPSTARSLARASLVFAGALVGFASGTTGAAVAVAPARERTYELAERTNYPAVDFLWNCLVQGSHSSAISRITDEIDRVCGDT